MPSTSAKQARTMQAAAHDPAFAKKMGIPQSVAREYAAADKHKEPDADDRGGRSDRDADDTRHPPRHHKSHDMPMRTPGRQHGTHDMPTKPGGGRRAE